MALAPLLRVSLAMPLGFMGSLASWKSASRITHSHSLVVVRSRSHSVGALPRDHFLFTLLSYHFMTTINIGGY